MKDGIAATLMRMAALILFAISCGRFGAWLNESSSQPSNIKVCAVALTVLHAEAECTQMPGCVMTEGDFERVLNAGADRQNYCPVLKPGEEGANQ